MKKGNKIFFGFIMIIIVVGMIVSPMDIQAAKSKTITGIAADVSMNNISIYTAKGNQYNMSTLDVSKNGAALGDIVRITYTGTLKKHKVSKVKILYSAKAVEGMVGEGTAMHTLELILEDGTKMFLGMKDNHATYIEDSSNDGLLVGNKIQVFYLENEKVKDATMISIIE